MWQWKACADGRWDQAISHLCRVDPVQRRLIERVGPCLLRPRRHTFVILCQSIAAQQVSTASATAIFKRFRALFPRKHPTPAGTLKLRDEQLAACGFSRQKKRYILDLAAHFADGRIQPRKLAGMDDEAVIETLTQVHGIGRWTAEMFLIFVLNRPDVWPIDDLGLRNMVREHYSLKTQPDKHRMIELAEPWRPWRTVAAWYFWAAGDGE